MPSISSTSPAASSPPTVTYYNPLSPTAPASPLPKRAAPPRGRTCPRLHGPRTPPHTTPHQPLPPMPALRLSSGADAAASPAAAPTAGSGGATGSAATSPSSVSPALERSPASSAASSPPVAAPGYNVNHHYHGTHDSHHQQAVEHDVFIPEYEVPAASLRSTFRRRTLNGF